MRHFRCLIKKHFLTNTDLFRCVYLCLVSGIVYPVHVNSCTTEFARDLCHQKACVFNQLFNCRGRNHILHSRTMVENEILVNVIKKKITYTMIQKLKSKNELIKKETPYTALKCRK